MANQEDNQIIDQHSNTSSSIDIEDPNENADKKKINKLPDEIVDQLEKAYQLNKYPAKEEKNDICEKLKLNVSQIDNWFKRRRQSDALKGSLDLPRKKYFDPEIKQKLSKIYNQHKEKVGEKYRCKFNKNEITILAKELQLTSKQIRSWFSGQRRKHASYLRRINKINSIQKKQQQVELQQTNIQTPLAEVQQQQYSQLQQEQQLKNSQTNSNAEEEKNQSSLIQQGSSGLSLSSSAASSNSAFNNQLQKINNNQSEKIQINDEELKISSQNNAQNISSQADIQQYILSQQQNQNNQQIFQNYLLQQQLPHQNLNSLLGQSTFKNTLLSQIHQQQMEKNQLQQKQKQQEQQQLLLQLQQQQLLNQSALSNLPTFLQQQQQQKQLQQVQLFQQQQIQQNPLLLQQLQLQTQQLLSPAIKAQKLQIINQFNNLLTQNEFQYQQQLLKQQSQFLLLQQQQQQQQQAQAQTSLLNPQTFNVNNFQNLNLLSNNQLFSPNNQQLNQINKKSSFDFQNNKQF